MIIIRSLSHYIVVAVFLLISMNNSALASTPGHEQGIRETEQVKAARAVTQKAQPGISAAEVVMGIAAMIGIGGGILIILGLILLLTPIYTIGIFLMRLGFIMFLGSWPIFLIANFISNRRRKRFRR